MLAISLMRLGAKKRPFYRVVVKEKRSKRDGKYIENLGTYNPMTEPAEVNLKHERIQYWISVGAQPSDTVASLIKNNPEMTEEEKAAKAQAIADKKEADRRAKEEAKKAEEARLAEEAKMAEEAKKAEEEKAAAEAAAETAEETPAEESSAGEAVAEETAAEEKPAEETAAEGE